MQIDIDGKETITVVKLPKLPKQKRSPCELMVEVADSPEQREKAYKHFLRLSISTEFRNWLLAVGVVLSAIAAAGKVLGWHL